MTFYNENRNYGAHRKFGFDINREIQPPEDVSIQEVLYIYGYKDYEVYNLTGEYSYILRINEPLGRQTEIALEKRATTGLSLSYATNYRNDALCSFRLGTDDKLYVHDGEHHIHITMEQNLTGGQIAQYIESDISFIDLEFLPIAASNIT